MGRGESRNYTGGAMDVPPRTQAPRIRVRLRLGRRYIRHLAWAQAVTPHTPGYTPARGPGIPTGTALLRASNKRPEANPPLHCPGQTHSATTTGGELETTHRAPLPGTHGPLARPTLPDTYICTEGTHRHGADWGIVEWGTTQTTHQNSALDWTDCHVPRVNPTHWQGPLT